MRDLKDFNSVARQIVIYLFSVCRRAFIALVGGIPGLKAGDTLIRPSNRTSSRMIWNTEFCPCDSYETICYAPT